MINEARLWCRGKQWWWRLLLLAWFVPLFIGLLKDPKSSHLFFTFNLCIHEMGHMLFGFTGKFWMAAGGTITQIAVPFLGMWNFYRQKDFFAICLCFGWLSTNFFNVSIYMDDARSMRLPLVTPFGGEVHHDWNYLFGQMGILPWDHVIAGLFWFLAVISMLFCFYSGGWILYHMLRFKNG